MKNIGLLLVLLNIIACGDNTKEKNSTTEKIEEVVEIIDTTPYDNMSLDEKNEALVVSSSNGELEAVKGLIASGAFVDFKDEFEMTPLMAASYSASYNTDDKYLEVVKYLVAKGADVNITTIKHDYIDTALTMSIQHGGESPEVVKFLIDSGADTSAVFKNMYDYNGNTAWGEAIEYGSIEIIKYLVAKGVDTNNTTIFDWARVGWLEKVQECVKNGADVNAIIKDNGFTALMGASAARNLEIVKYLIENGADINIQNQFNYTALDIAKESEDTEIIEYLESLK